jgi:hypothetical protein
MTEKDAIGTIDLQTKVLSIEARLMQIEKILFNRINPSEKELSTITIDVLKEMQERYPQYNIIVAVDKK